MDKFKVIIESFDEKKVYNCVGEHHERGFYLDKFNFIVLSSDALMIENTIPVNNKIPLKLNKKLSFKYNSMYGIMNLESKLFEFKYNENYLYLVYELYNNEQIIGKYKVELNRKTVMN